MQRSECSRTSHCASAPTLARLLIHATAGDDGGMLSVLLHRLRACTKAATCRRPGTSVGVRIDDLQGRRFFTSEEVRAVVEVPLPAGTYHVSVRHVNHQRRYTVTLEHGAAFDLHLCGMMDPR